MFIFDYDIHLNADINPDTNCYHDISNDCQYYTDHQISNFISDKVFSIMHFNCRSICKFTYWETFVTDLHFMFDAIALSNIWLNGTEYLGLFQLNGYNFCHRNGQSRRGGGVAIYAKDDIKFNVL